MRSPRSIDAGAVLAWAAVFAAAAAVRMAVDLGTPPVAEALIYLALLLGLARSSALSRAWSVLAGPRRSVIALLIAGMTAGQLVDSGRDTFPFVDWGMYSQPMHGDPSYFGYTAKLADGREVRFDVFRALSSLASRYVRPLDITATKLLENDAGPEQAALETSYDRAVAAIAEAWNRDHPDERIVEVQVWRYTVPLAGYAGPASIRREPFRRVPVVP